MSKHADSRKYADHFLHNHDQPVRSRKYIKATLAQSRQDLKAALQDLSMLNQRIHVR